MEHSDQFQLPPPKTEYLLRNQHLVAEDGGGAYQFRVPKCEKMVRNRVVLAYFSAAQNHFATGSN